MIHLPIIADHIRVRSNQPTTLLYFRIAPLIIVVLLIERVQEQIFSLYSAHV